MYVRCLSRQKEKNMVHVELSVQPLTQEQIKMIEDVYPDTTPDEINNLAVVLLDHSHRKGEYIIDTSKLAEEDQWQEDQADNFLGSIIFANVEWLKRYHAKLVATQALQPLPEVRYDEFAHPEMVHTLDAHALAQDHLTQLRDSGTQKGAFNQHAHELTRLLLTAATKDLALTTKQTTTPMTGTLKVTSLRLTKKAAAFVSILRAGDLMTNVAAQVLPDATVGKLGMRRVHSDPKSRAEHYYESLEGVESKEVVLVFDPMLATGGSMCDAIDALKKKSQESGKIQTIRVMALIAAPEGIRRVQEKHPDVEIYVAAIDSHLTETNYIDGPGLGDAGDRGFGTF
jgi:uracil phosphoribosyltransferase